MSKENKNHLFKKAGIYAVTIILIAGAFVPTASSCHPGVKIEKTGPIFGYVGEEITYFYNVSNTGDMPLWGIGISDDQVRKVYYVSGDDNTPWACIPDS